MGKLMQGLWAQRDYTFRRRYNFEKDGGDWTYAKARQQPWRRIVHALGATIRMMGELEAAIS